MSERKIRVLIAKPGLDGHDRGAKVVARSLRDAGFEVIYTGIRQTPQMIAEAALQEDVDVVGLSILSGAHLTLCPKVVELLRSQGQDNVLVLVGGIVPDEDVAKLKASGITGVFGPGTSTQEIADYINQNRAGSCLNGRDATANARSAGDLVRGVLNGQRLLLARTITRVENQEDDAADILAALYPHTGHAHIIGVTGAPGTGKSTLVTALAQSYRQLGLTVGIVAIDPTSPFTGGALLGDRVRMRSLAGDTGVFVRSMATRGSLGGLSKTTGDVVTVLDAAGFDRVIVETVGVGQAEVEIASTAHTTLVVEAPGLGDEVQAIKAGILEIADILVVNKADRPGVDKTLRALEMMLEIEGGGPRLIRHHGQLLRVETPLELAEEEGRWQVIVMKTVAMESTGVFELRERIEAHRHWLTRFGRTDDPRAVAYRQHARKHHPCRAEPPHPGPPARHQDG